MYNFVLFYMTLLDFLSIFLTFHDLVLWCVTLCYSRSVCIILYNSYYIVWLVIDLVSSTCLRRCFRLKDELQIEIIYFLSWIFCYQKKVTVPVCPNIKVLIWNVLFNLLCFIQLRCPKFNFTPAVTLKFDTLWNCHFLLGLNGQVYMTKDKLK